MHGHELGIGAQPHLRRLHHRDRFDAAGDADVHPVDDHLLGGGGDRHQARGALAVDRHARHGDGKAGAQRGGAPDRRLHALLERGADDDVVDLGRVDARALDRGADGVGGQGRRGRGVERAAIGLADRRAGGGDDDGFAVGHGSSFQTKIMPIQSAVKAGLSSPSISTVTWWTNCHWPGRFSSNEKREAAADALAGTDRGDEADLLEAVIHRHLDRRRDQHHAGRHLAQQRQGQEAVRDGAAERRLRGRGGVDMDELVIAGHVGERVDRLLVDQDPVGDADLGADAGLDLFEVGDGHGCGLEARRYETQAP